VAKQLSSPAGDLLRQQFLASGDARSLVAARTALVEEAVLEAWQEHLARRFSAGLAVLAVGGFGRRELFPFSDVDVLLLAHAEPRSQPARDAIAGFLRSLWDKGLRASHSLRTPAECCQLHGQNPELNVSLLDVRFLAGEQELFENLRPRLARFVHAERRALARHLCRLARRRHARFQDTIYHLEPNIKETPGGLRDLQLVRWLRRLRSVSREDLPDEPLPSDLEPARNLLWTLRCFLHLQAGRDQNRLTFDAQEELAEQPFAAGRDPAAWMRDYFQQARCVYRAAVRSMEEWESEQSSLFAQFRDWRSRLSNLEFSVSRERVYFKTPAALQQDPVLVLRLFEFTARHGVRPSSDSERRIAECLPQLAEWFRRGQPLWSVFRSLLSLPHFPLALRAMHETGVLGALFPEWAEIESRVVRDFYHRYTVDEHTLVSMEVLAGLPQADDPLRRRFALLLEEVEDRSTLLCALLFHDTGKGISDVPHVPESVRRARQALERIGAPAPVTRQVCALIERHLDLSTVMNTRDLEEPATARHLAQRAGTIEELKLLTLMTYADVSAVNPVAMTPWRLEQLWRVYVVAHKELTRELEAERIQQPEADSPEKAAFLEGLPTRYLRTHSPEDIERDFQLHQRALERGVCLTIARRNSSYCLTLAARDRPFLLASIAGALSAFGMNILRAEAFGNRHGMVLDTFLFEDPNRTLELNPSEMDRFRLTVERAVLGKVDVRQLLARRPTAAPSPRRPRLRPSVTFDSELSPTATLIEVVAEDRPGLLYDLAYTISSAGCNIEVVLIDTEAHKALDVFYVTIGGHKLWPEHETALREKLLRVCQI
jgi:[protein-PII] uridylyltransferase